MPQTFYFGITTICDISCPYCPRQFYTEEVEPGLMDFDSFAPLAGCLEYAEEAYFFGLGEPFLHPRFFDFLSLSRKTGVRMETSSHGMSLDKKTREKILASGLDVLTISLDGAKPQTFEFLRKGARFETVLSNIAALQKEKIMKGTNKPAVYFATAVSQHNVDELPSIVKLAKKLGCVRVVFTDLILVDQKNASLSVAKTDLFKINLDKAKALGEKYGIEVLYFFQYPFPWKKDPPPKGKRYACRDPWRICIIDREGKVKPCCYYPPFTGNIFKESLEDIINNEKSRKLRRALLQGNIPDCCVNCGMLTELTPEISINAIKTAEKMLEQEKNIGVLNKKNIDDLSALIKQYYEKWGNRYNS